MLWVLAAFLTGFGFFIKYGPKDLPLRWRLWSYITGTKCKEEDPSSYDLEGGAGIGHFGSTMSAQNHGSSEFRSRGQGSIGIGLASSGGNHNFLGMAPLHQQPSYTSTVPSLQRVYPPSVPPPIAPSMGSPYQHTQLDHQRLPPSPQPNWQPNPPIAMQKQQCAYVPTAPAELPRPGQKPPRPVVQPPVAAIQPIVKAGSVSHLGSAIVVNANAANTIQAAIPYDAPPMKGGTAMPLERPELRPSFHPALALAPTPAPAPAPAAAPAPAPTGGLSAPSIVYADLKMEHQIGGGAFGVVWKGSWRGTPVAVKELNATCQGILNEQGIRAFEDEVNIMHALRHPNICLFMGASLSAQNRVIVTELVSGGSLWDCLRAKDPMFKQMMQKSFPGQNNTCTQSHWPVYVIKKIVEGTCQGLAYLHAHAPQPIIHRDLKSANLLLTESFDVKICDFGLARLRDVTNVMTANVGTVHWMAPEVLSGKKYSEKADMYSLAVVIWEMFTGLCPYEGKTQVQIAVGVSQKGLRPELPSFLPYDARACISECWHLNPAKRPGAQQLLQQVATIFK